MTWTYATAMTADVTELASLLGIGVVTAAAEQQERAAKLARNHGFLKGLMTRVGKHFQAAGAGAWRILSSGGVWFGLLSVCVSAVLLLFQARDLRHYKQQPTLGKLRVLSVGASFGAFIMTFLGFFKKIAMAWKNESEDEQEKRRAAELLSRLDHAERAALMAKSQAAHAATGEHNMYTKQTLTPAFSMLATALTTQGAVIDTHIAEAGVDEILAKARKWARRKRKETRNLGAAIVDMLRDSDARKSLALMGAGLAALVISIRGQLKLIDDIHLQHAKLIFDKIERSRRSISPAVYSEVAKARGLVTKALAAA